MKIFSNSVFTAVLFFMIININTAVAQYATPQPLPYSSQLETLKNELKFKPLESVNATYRTGENDLVNYFPQNLKYPEIAFDYQIEGEVVVEFFVDKEGGLENFKVVESLGYGCDAEALTAVKNMSNWIPARQGKRNVGMWVRIPVKFSLQ